MTCFQRVISDAIMVRISSGELPRTLVAHRLQLTLHFRHIEHSPHFAIELLDHRRRHALGGGDAEP